MEQTSLQNLDELIRLFVSPHYASRFVLAKTTHTCIACGKPAHTFRECLARLDYESSGICEGCQERFLKK